MLLSHFIDEAALFDHSIVFLEDAALFRFAKCTDCITGLLPKVENMSTLIYKC